jgi:pimeloyl-ACP methyl ester carboxylesterase
MPDADLVEYSEAGHCPHIEIPDWVARDIAERLAR